MAGILTTIASIIALVLILILSPIAKQRLSLLLASRRHVCAPPPREPSKDPIFNLDIILARVRARKEKNSIKKNFDDFVRFGRTLEAYPLGYRDITTCDPRNIQFFLATEADNFGNAPSRAVIIPLLGKGIMNQDGAAWRNSRGLIMPTFTRSRIADRDFFDRHFGRFLDGLPKDGTAVDLKPLFEELVSCTFGSY